MITAFAPRAAATTASAAPRPVEAPVTRTILPSKSRIGPSVARHASTRIVLQASRLLRGGPTPSPISIGWQTVHVAYEVGHLPNLLLGKHAIPTTHAGIAHAILDCDEGLLRRDTDALLPELR